MKRVLSAALAGLMVWTPAAMAVSAGTGTPPTPVGTTHGTVAAGDDSRLAGLPLNGRSTTYPVLGVAGDAGLIAEYRFEDGVSATGLADSSGNGNNITFPSSAAPTMNADGSASWTGGTTTFLSVPGTATGVQWVEIMFSGAVATPANGQLPPSVLFNTLAGYSGGSGVSTIVNFSTRYNQSSTVGQGYGTRWLGFGQSTASAGTSGVIDNGLHVVDLAINTSGSSPNIVSVYLNNVLTSKLDVNPGNH